MQTILAIDPAWTNNEPSGVALIAGSGDHWKCLALAPSYAAFLALARGVPVCWRKGAHRGAPPDPSQLLKAAQCITPTGMVDLVTVDMPLSIIPFASRREADNAVSREFGGRGCGTHTPNESRPGHLSQTITEGFGSAGFPLATKVVAPGCMPALLEVYPHPALLRLMQAERRLPYKVAKSGKYWPGCTREARLVNLCRMLADITDRLAEKISGIHLPIPAPQTIGSLAALKPYEDALDALVSAWVGICYLQGKAIAYGDQHAAIWVPE